MNKIKVRSGKTLFLIVFLFIAGCSSIAYKTIDYQSLYGPSAPKQRIKKQYESVISGKVKDIAWTSDNQRIAAVGEGKMSFGKIFFLDTGSSVGEISQISKQLNAVDIRPIK